MAATDKPLAGKRIVVTRVPEQALELTSTLEQMGAEVIALPLVAFAPPENWRALDEALQTLARFDAILFLSRNAVRYVAGRCKQMGIDGRTLVSSDRLIAAVGPATAEEAAHWNVRVNFVAENRTGESLVRELRERLAGRSVLLPRSDRGDSRVPSALREVGAIVTEVAAYRTVVPENLDSGKLQTVCDGDIDAIVFASPSAFKHFEDTIGRSALKKISERVHFASIGPTTSRAIRESGVPVDIEVADSASIGISALGDALVQFFQQRATVAPVRSA